VETEELTIEIDEEEADAERKISLIAKALEEAGRQAGLVGPRAVQLASNEEGERPVPMEETAVNPQLNLEETGTPVSGRRTTVLGTGGGVYTPDGGVSTPGGGGGASTPGGGASAPGGGGGGSTLVGQRGGEIKFSPVGGAAALGGGGGVSTPGVGTAVPGGGGDQGTTEEIETIPIGDVSSQTILFVPETPPAHGFITTPLLISTTVMDRADRFQCGTTPSRGSAEPMCPGNEEHEESDGESSTSPPSYIHREGHGQKRVADDRDNDEADRQCYGYNRAYKNARYGPRHGEPLVGGGLVRRRIEMPEVLVKRVTARSWLEEGLEDEDYEESVEDLDDELYNLIKATPLPWTTAKILKAAGEKYHDVTRIRLRSVISALLLAMRRTSQDILARCIAKGPPAPGDKAVMIPLDMEVILQYMSTK